MGQLHEVCMRSFPLPSISYYSLSQRNRLNALYHINSNNISLVTRPPVFEMYVPLEPVPLPLPRTDKGTTFSILKKPITINEEQN